ncbi:MAG: ABC transporter permease [Planctomycetes bacterium]|nr:ABC transporter permease [Planctomycetota bacterium]
MKFFAFLKDSFRETLDSKVLYVTFGLSLLLMLLLGSVSFRMVPIKEQLDGLCWLYGLAFGQGSSTTAEVVDARQLNAPEDAWKGDYQFTLAVRFPDEDRARSGAVQAGQLEFFTREMFWWLKDLKVRKVDSANKSEVHLEFTSRGTRLNSDRSWPHEPGLFFGALPLGPLFRQSLAYWVYWIENRLVNGAGGWLVVLLAVVVTAPFVPNMLRKGTVDFIVSKPIRRPALLAFKYIGGLTFVFLNALIAIGGIWFVLGLRTGIWAPGFLVSVLIITFFFAVLYAVSTLFGVLSRSAILSILMTCAVWAILWVVGLVYKNIHTPESASAARMREAQSGRLGQAEGPQTNPGSPSWLRITADSLHAVLPRTDDLGTLTTLFLSNELLSEGERDHLEFKRDIAFSWTASIGICLAYIGVLLGLACWRFATKDY